MKAKILATIAIVVIIGTTVAATTISAAMAARPETQWCARGSGGGGFCTGLQDLCEQARLDLGVQGHCHERSLP